MQRRDFLKAVALGAVGASSGLLTRPAFAADVPEKEVDVVIVGAGLSGLSAARKLKRAGKRVMVLEARNRIGGRMVLKKTIENGVLDIGGQWVGPTQTAFLGLIEELKIEKFDSYEEGNSILSWNGAKSNFDGNVSKVLAGAYGATQSDRDAEAKLWNEFMEIVKTVPADKPWAAPNAKWLDSLTFQTWMESKSTQPYSMWPLAMQARIGGSGGFEPSQTSLLHMAWTQVVGPQSEIPEMWLLHGGAGQVPARLAAELEGQIVLDAPVLEIVQSSNGVEVRTLKMNLKAGAVIVAVPPPLRATIQFTPALPPIHRGLIQRVPMGSMSKVHAVYPTAFWRPQGLSGSAAGNLETCEFIADSGPPSGKPGILTSFIAGERNLELATASKDEIQKLVLADYMYYFGKEAGSPAEFFHFNWNDQPWTTGAFTNYMPPGTWTAYGPALRQPVDRVFWAGTEASTRWPGYFDGAIRAGLEAADGTLKRLG